MRFSRQSTGLIDRRKYPSEIGFAIDLYTLPGIEDSTKDMLENEFFRNIDQRASDVITKLERAGTANLTENDRLSWIVFLISLRQRNPEKLLDIGRQAAEALQKDIGLYRQQYELRREEGGSQSFDEFIERIRQDGWFERTNKLLVRGAILLPQTAQALLSFVWKFVVFSPPEYELLTSDRPVVMTNGLAHAEGHMAIPIGPRKLFIAARDRKTMLEIIRRPRLVSIVNDILSYGKLMARSTVGVALSEAL